MGHPNATGNEGPPAGEGRGSDPKGPKVMRRETYPRVKRGHIVPAVYLRNFSVTDQVAVHRTDRPGCELRNVRTVGTHGPFYRRERPDGSGEALTPERKSALAQFFAMQMVRGPAFFRERAELIDDVMRGLGDDAFQPAAVADAGGDVEVVRRKAQDAQLSTTARFVTMLSTGSKLGAVLGSMRWHVLDFGAPVLAVSDHPVVTWPADVRMTEAFTAPRLGPLGAVEVRVPLSDRMGILMTWQDVPDAGVPVPAQPRLAAELNAFVVGQADRQWMHCPGVEPVVPPGQFGPLYRSFELGYSALSLADSKRRAHAQAFLERVRYERFLGEIDIVDLKWNP
jgi:hypothetical protein